MGHLKIARNTLQSRDRKGAGCNTQIDGIMHGQAARLLARAVLFARQRGYGSLVKADLETMDFELMSG
jgi:hypothetical protein